MPIILWNAVPPDGMSNIIMSYLYFSYTILTTADIVLSY